MAALSEREVRVLAFERGWWRSPGAKEQEIRDVLGMNATSYYQLLNELIDRPEALMLDPALVKRLRRQRARRHKMRSACRTAATVRPGERTGGVARAS